jgi:hypothetical protein
MQNLSLLVTSSYEFYHIFRDQQFLYIVQKIIVEFLPAVEKNNFYAKSYIVGYKFICMDFVVFSETSNSRML